MLYLKGVSFCDLQLVIDFMYNGEVRVAQDELNSFLSVAEDLKINGLSSKSRPKSNSDNQQPLPPGATNIPNKASSTHCIRVQESYSHPIQQIITPTEGDNPKKENEFQEYLVKIEPQESFQQHDSANEKRTLSEESLQNKRYKINSGAKKESTNTVKLPPNFWDATNEKRTLPEGSRQNRSCKLKSGATEESTNTEKLPVSFWL